MVIMIPIMPMMYPHQTHIMPSAMQTPLVGAVGAPPTSNLPRDPHDSVEQHSVKEVRDGIEMKNEPQKGTPVPAKIAGQDEQLKQQKPVIPGNPASNLGQEEGLQLNLAPPQQLPLPSSPTRPEAPAEAEKSLRDKPTLNPETKTESDQFSCDAPILCDEKFEVQMEAWNRQFENWKEQNQNHPDRDAYRRYERQGQYWSEQLLARREQMRQLSNRFPNKLGPGSSKDVATTAEGSNEYRNLSQINTSEPGLQMKNVEESTQIGPRNTGLGQDNTTPAHRGKPPAIEGARAKPRPLMEVTPVIPAGRFARQSEQHLQQQPQQQAQSQSRGGKRGVQRGLMMGIQKRGFCRSGSDEDEDNSLIAAKFGNRRFDRGDGDGDQDDAFVLRFQELGFGRGRGIGQPILRRNEELVELGFGRNLRSGGISRVRGRGGGLGERGFGQGRGGLVNSTARSDEKCEDYDIQSEPEPGMEVQSFLIRRGRGVQSLQMGRGCGEQSLQLGRGCGAQGALLGRGRGEQGALLGRGPGEQGALSGRGCGWQSALLGRGPGEQGALSGRGHKEQGTLLGRGPGKQSALLGRGPGEQGALLGRGPGEQGAPMRRGHGEQGALLGRGRGWQSALLGRGPGEQGALSGRGHKEQGALLGRGPGKQGALLGRGPGEQGALLGRRPGEQSPQMGRGRGGLAVPGRQLDVHGQAMNTNVRDMQFADDDPIDSSTHKHRQHQPIAQLLSKPNYLGLVSQVDQKVGRPSLLGDPNKSEVKCPPSKLSATGSNTDEKAARSIQQKNQTIHQSQQSASTRQSPWKPPESEKPNEQRQTDHSKSQGVTDSAITVKPFETSTTSTRVVETVKPAVKNLQKQDNAGAASSSVLAPPGPGKDWSSAAEDKGTSHPEKAADSIPKEKEGTQITTPSVEPGDQEKVETSPAKHSQDQPDATAEPRQRVSRFTPAEPSASDNSTGTSNQAVQQKPSADGEDDVEILFVTLPVFQKPQQGQQQPSWHGERCGVRANRGEYSRGRCSLPSSRGDHASQRSRNENEDLCDEKRASDDRGKNCDRGSTRNRSRDKKGRGQRRDHDREQTSHGRDSERHSESDFNQSRGGDRYNQRSRDRSTSRGRSRASPPSNRCSVEHDGDRSSQRWRQIDEGRFFRRDDDQYEKEAFVPDVSLPAERRRGQNLRDVSNYIVYGDVDNTYKIEEPGSGPSRVFQIERERLYADVLDLVDMRLLAMATRQQIEPTYGLRPDLNFEPPAAKVPRVEHPLVTAEGTISRALTKKEQEIIVKTAEKLKALQDQKKMAELVSAPIASNPQPLSNAASNINSAEWSAFGRTSEHQRQELNVQDREGHFPDNWPEGNHANHRAAQDDSKFYEDQFDEDCDQTRNFETENKLLYSRRATDEDVPARDRWDRDEQYSQGWVQPCGDETSVAGGCMEAPVSIDYGHKSADSTRNAFQLDNFYTISGAEEDYGMRESSLRTNRPEPQFVQRRELEDRYKDTSRDTGRVLGRHSLSDSDKSRDLDRVSSRKISESDRRDQGCDSSRDRSHDTDSHLSCEGHSEESKNKHETVLIEDLIGSDGRRKRPSRIVLILRGPPGSGKTYVANLIKDKDIEHSGGANAIRMLCLDDYFSVDVVQTNANLQCYKNDPVMVDRYRNSLYKTFRKTVDDGFFHFIIVDAIHNKVRHFDKIWSYAKQKGFQVYIAEMDTDAVTCYKRNIHNRSLEEIQTILMSWEPAPSHYLRVDIRSLLQDAAIPTVEMEDTVVEGERNKQVEEKEHVTEKADLSVFKGFLEFRPTMMSTVPSNNGPKWWSKTF